MFLYILKTLSKSEKLKHFAILSFHSTNKGKMSSEKYVFEKQI